MTAKKISSHFLFVIKTLQFRKCCTKDILKIDIFLVEKTFLYVIKIEKYVFCYTFVTNDTIMKCYVHIQFIFQLYVKNEF